MLRALKHEKNSGKTLLDCRPLSAVAEELRLSQSDFNAAVGLLIEKQAIDAADRPDGKAALPSPKGDALLESKKQESSWTMERRLTLYGIILTIVTIVSVLAARCTQK